ncbi:MAG: hypothetical protein JST21_17970 [Bacteroidetes bacterium]|nr:hypothetical protein [Bacteroidota bacterium]
MENYEVQNGSYLITTDKSKLQVDVIHQFLAEESYWAQGIPKKIVEKATLPSGSPKK